VKRFLHRAGPPLFDQQMRQVSPAERTRPALRRQLVFRQVNAEAPQTLHHGAKTAGAMAA
jgi:hypothetical protein